MVCGIIFAQWVASTLWGQLLQVLQSFLLVCHVWCAVSAVMPVWPVAQVSVWFSVPIIFHESPMVAFILCWASYYPLPVSAFIGVAACHPFSLLIHRVVAVWGTVSTWEHSWHSSRLFSGSLAEATGSSYSITALIPMRYQLILFLSILILALYSFILREVTKRVPFWFRPCVDCLRPWTMIFPWIFLFLYRQVFAYGQ